MRPRQPSFHAGAVLAGRLLTLVCTLALPLTLAGCDRCGDFFWEKHPSTCRAAPSPG
jgi:hypothetical protein